MSHVSRLHFRRVGEQVTARYEGRRLARSTSAALYRLLVGHLGATPLDGTVVRIRMRDGDMVIDLFRDAAESASAERLGTLTAGEAYAVYWLLYSPGKDPLLPITIEVVAHGAPRQGAGAITFQQSA
ncbi:MAG TPA: hypothetical protein P5572_18655 [Phycisphaerae bacterium]|nr:hypothetical protein [Phycisphaerales bacterium]HRX87050.1 hypothetical protein [Phycisphaerae bacterium]